MKRWRMTPSGEPEVTEGPGLGDMVRGAVGVAKAALGVQAAPVAEVQARWAFCQQCDQHDCGRCLACGCFTGAKIRVAGESCPLGKWVAVTVDSQPPKPCCGRKSG
jgi:hypothetical protein